MRTWFLCLGLAAMVGGAVWVFRSGPKADRPAPKAVVARIEKVALIDVHPLHGGSDVWLSADGSWWSRRASSAPGGFREERFRGQIPPEEARSLMEAIRLEGHESPSGPFLPDEEHPVLWVVSGGKVRSWMKRGSDPWPEFEATRKTLEALASRAESKGESLGVRAYDPSWRPEGFPSVRPEVR